MIKKFFQNIKKVYKYSRGCRKYIFAYLITSFLIMLVGIVVPMITSVQLVSLTEGVWNQVIVYSLFAFGLSLLRAILDFIASTASRIFSKKVVSKIQIELG